MKKRAGRGGRRTPGPGKTLGRPRKPKEEIKPVDKKLAIEILESLAIPDAEWKLKHPDEAKDKPCHCEICLWRDDCLQRNASGSAARKFLWEQARGKAVHTVNHLHDKPLEMNVTLSMAELVRKVRQRKQEYERNRN